MNIVIVEPFFTGSHQSWAEGFQKHSKHKINILSLPGRNWKWRMHGGAITLANLFLKLKDRPDLIIASDMLDLSTFLALTKTSSYGIPIAIYFHENQLSYPWSPTDKDVVEGRDFHYGFMNWTSILSADKVFFNSTYNRDSFYVELERLLKSMPDYKELQLIELAKSNSQVLPLGINLSEIKVDIDTKDYSKPVILWNHRWEYDKNPNDFHKALIGLKTASIAFELIICGEGFTEIPDTFDKIKSDFAAEIVHFGYAASKEEYITLLKRANIIPVTSKQEFFGQSVIEAITAGCFPLLPNTLAYPEHIPESLKAIFLYKDFEQLQTNLKDVCSDLISVKELIRAIQEVVVKYDWMTIIEQYDQSFEEMKQ